MIKGFSKSHCCGVLLIVEKQKEREWEKERTSDWKVWPVIIEPIFICWTPSCLSSFLERVKYKQIKYQAAAIHRWGTLWGAVFGKGWKFEKDLTTVLSGTCWLLLTEHLICVMCWALYTHYFKSWQQLYQTGGYVFHFLDENIENWKDEVIANKWQSWHLNPGVSDFTEEQFIRMWIDK